MIELLAAVTGLVRIFDQVTFELYDTLILVPGVSSERVSKSKVTANESSNRKLCEPAQNEQRNVKKDNREATSSPSYLLLFTLVAGALFARWTSRVRSTCAIIVLFLAVIFAIGRLAQLPFLPSPTSLVPLALLASVMALRCRTRARPTIGAFVQLCAGYKEARWAACEV
jgi:hypothetical protein